MAAGWPVRILHNNQRSQLTPRLIKHPTRAVKASDSQMNIGSGLRTQNSALLGSTQHLYGPAPLLSLGRFGGRLLPRLGATEEIIHLRIFPHEGRKTGRVRPRPLAKLLPPIQKRTHADDKPGQNPNEDFHRDTFRLVNSARSIAPPDARPY